MKHLFTITFVLLGLQILGQVEVKQIKIDFKKKELIKDVKKIKRGEYYQLEIENVNLNVYKITFDSEDSTLSKKLELEQLLSFNTGGLLDLLKLVVTNTTSSLSLPLKNEIFQPDRKELFNPTGISPSLNETEKTDILSSIEKFNNSIIYHKSELWGVKFRLEKFSTNLIIQLESQKMQGSLMSNNLAEEFRVNINAFYDEINTCYSNVVETQKELNSFITKNHVSSKDSILNVRITSISNNLHLLINAAEEGLAIISDSAVQSKISAITNYTNNSSRTYKSLPTQFTKEQAKLDISMVPIAPNSTLPSYHTTLQFPTINPWYMSMGLGMYLSKMHDETFSTVARAINDTTQGYTLIQESGLKNESGISIAARFGYRFEDTGLFGIHGMVGTGLSFTKSVRPRLMLGAGISFGDKHRLAIDGGFITGYSDRLSNAFNTETIYLENPVNPVVSTLQKSTFLSIGYIYSF